MKKDAVQRSRWTFYEAITFKGTDMLLRRVIITLFLSMILVGAHPTHSAERVWVSSFDAKLKADKTASSQTLAVLTVGAELTVNSENDRWYLVTAQDGKKGWIYRGKVSSEPPQPSGEKTEGDSVGKLLTGLTGSRIGSGEVDTSRSMRMLSVEKKKKQDGSQPDQNYEEALESVLSRRITDIRVDQFLEAGKIGEYAP